MKEHKSIVWNSRPMCKKCKGVGLLTWVDKVLR